MTHLHAEKRKSTYLEISACCHQGGQAVTKVKTSQHREKGRVHMYIFGIYFLTFLGTFCTMDVKQSTDLVE